MNFYNEFDPKAAAWLRELIKAGLIPPGHVDERSITEIKPSDLAAYTQCHFFAGIGGWSLALELAGWPADRPVGTGSCPCQPWSDAGKQLGASDDRHLWPAFFKLIVGSRALGQRWAFTILGEQVASKAALGWLDGVFADLEGAGYTCGAADLCAASVGAPQIRQRLHWVGYANEQRRGEGNRQLGQVEGPGCRQSEPAITGSDSGLAFADSDRCNQGRERIPEAGRDGSVGDSRIGRLDEPSCVGGASGFSGQDARQEGHAGIADNAGGEPDQTRPDQTRPCLAGAVQAHGIGRTQRA